MIKKKKGGNDELFHDSAQTESEVWLKKKTKRFFNCSVYFFITNLFSAAKLIIQSNKIKKSVSKIFLDSVFYLFAKFAYQQILQCFLAF